MFDFGVFSADQLLFRTNFHTRTNGPHDNLDRAPQNSGPTTISTTLLHASFDAMFRFAHLNRLRQASLRLFAKELGEAQISADTRAVFAFLDKTGDGVVSCAELAAAARSCGYAQAELHEFQLLAEALGTSNLPSPPPQNARSSKEKQRNKRASVIPSPELVLGYRDLIAALLLLEVFPPQQRRAPPARKTIAPTTLLDDAWLRDLFLRFSLGGEWITKGGLQCTLAPSRGVWKKTINGLSSITEAELDVLQRVV